MDQVGSPTRDLSKQRVYKLKKFAEGEDDDATTDMWLGLFSLDCVSFLLFVGLFG